MFVKGYIPKEKSSKPDISQAESMLEAISLFSQIKTIRDKVIAAFNIKTSEVDKKIEEVDQKISEFDAKTAEAIKEIKSLPHLQGDPGQNADEQKIIQNVLRQIPVRDEDIIAERVLAKIPRVMERVDEDALAKRVLAQMPKNSPSLKVVRENVEIDPIAVIEKIMALPDGKFKLKTGHIDGLEQTIAAFQSQLGRGYLHGGGDTVAAGTNITITTNANGQKVISATSGGFTSLDPTQTPDGSRTTFTFAAALAKPSYIIQDGIWMKATSKAGTINWTWNSGTKVATMTIPPIDDIEGIV